MNLSWDRPLVLVSQRGQDTPPPATKSQALTLGTTNCEKCGAALIKNLISLAAEPEKVVTLLLRLPIC